MQARIDALVRRDIASGRVAGAAVAILQDGKPVFIRGYGRSNLELGASVDENTVFRIGSLTKQFTAAGVLILAEQNKLKIDDKLSVYLPDFPRADEITLRDLLNHTSGIHNFTEGPLLDEISTRSLTVQQLSTAIAKQSPLYDFKPGSRWWYSNSNYALLGSVIEKVSGLSWRAFMKVEVFDKLGMTDTSVDDARDIVSGRASGYSLVGGAAGKFRNADFTDMSVPYAAGGLRSTAADLVRWNSGLFGGKLLKSQSLKEMLAPGYLRDGSLNQSAIAWPDGKAASPPAGLIPGYYAFGFDHRTENGHRIVGHDGDIAGFAALVQIHIDDGITFIVITNTDGAAWPIYEEIYKAISP